ncbi:hypothetical protein EXS65_03230 [Candidatus Peribacteria bacterium]|nr:hypothetical protein [Candidatus Peribacteria bacterium]
MGIHAPSIGRDVVSMIASAAKPATPSTPPPMEYSATPPQGTILGKFIQFAKERRQATMQVVDGLQHATQHERN